MTAPSMSLDLRSDIAGSEHPVHRDHTAGQQTLVSTKGPNRPVVYGDASQMGIVQDPSGTLGKPLHRMDIRTHRLAVPQPHQDIVLIATGDDGTASCHCWRSAQPPSVSSSSHRCWRTRATGTSGVGINRFHRRVDIHAAAGPRRNKSPGWLPGITPRLCR
jgi:hypothetical protein